MLHYRPQGLDTRKEGDDVNDPVSAPHSLAFTLSLLPSRSHPLDFPASICLCPTLSLPRFPASLFFFQSRSPALSAPNPLAFTLWLCRGTSPIRNSAPLGPYSRVTPRILGGPTGRGLFLMSEVPLYPPHPLAFTLSLDLHSCPSLSTPPPLFHKPPAPTPNRHTLLGPHS